MIPRRAEVTDTIRRRLFSAMHLGLVKQGGRLPSVRELGQELEVDPRVVLAAYRKLEAEGLVELRQRSGIFVAPAATLRHSDPEVPANWMVEVLMQGLLHGTPALKMPDGLHRCLETLRLHAVVVECNADQLYSVPAELRRDYGLEVTAVDLDSLDRNGWPPAAIRQADILVTTPFHKAQVDRLAPDHGTPKVVITMCSDLFVEVKRLLPATPVYFVVVDPRFAVKLHKIFEGDAGASNLRTLVIGQEDLGTIPAEAPTYLTQLARQRVGDSPLLRRVWPEVRIFSDESARHILSFIVRANLQALAGMKRA